MTQKELIRQEIERLKIDYLNRGYTFVPVSMQQLLEFIDSLPEEKPSEDLEEAAEMAARKIYPYEGGTKGLICENSTPIYKAGFIAGAEWQREKMKKEELEGEIWEAINRYELEKKLNHEKGD